MGIPLVVQCHSIVSQLAHWRQIGRLQIRPTPRIWRKPRLLIGRELEMLASHWWRGPSEIYLRGYPYNPEPVLIERYWPQLALDWFIPGPANRPLAFMEASERLAILQMNLVLLRQGPMNQMNLIDIPLADYWHSNGRQIAFHWHSIGIPLEVNWYLIGSQISFNWKLIDI